MQDALRQAVDKYIPDLVALRHDLHAEPELRFEEYATADRIAQFLESAGIPFTRGHALGTGIVATIEGRPGPAVVLRADMDALEIQEETNLPYASRIPGRMHACGHDGHIACLCGAAQLLSEQRHSLQGRVKCIFQPAEEQAAGGRRIVEEGLIDDAVAAFALHTWPAYPVGVIAIGEGPVMACADFFRIDIEGRGGHGADPAATVDPALVAAHIVTALQTIVAREIDPGDPAVITIARIESGATSNIIPDRAFMEGTFRALDPAVRQHIARAIPRITENVAAAFRAKANVSILDEFGYPPLINDPAMADLARDVVRDFFGPEALANLPRPYMTAEDFAFYLQKVPGAMLLLGNAAPGQCPPPLHTSRFDFNDDALPIGAEALARIALRFFANNSDQ
jgi:hippurate hydrolase